MINDLETTNVIAEIINNADGVVILAGAGMGVDAGIPDFRGNTGLWTAEKDNFIKFANGSAFHIRPLETWNFYIERLIKYSQYEPHRGYYDLLKLNKDMFVVTSNVDGHFERSGWDSNRLYEIHGNLKWIQCSDHCCDDVQPMPEFTQALTNIKQAPHCPHCGKVSRPVVMMFEDAWFVGKHAIEQSRRYLKWAEGKKNIVGIEIGAGTAVPSIRMFGEQQTRSLIRINPHDYEIYRRTDIAIPEGAVKGIDIILGMLNLS